MLLVYCYQCLRIHRCIIICYYLLLLLFVICYPLFVSIVTYWRFNGKEPSLRTAMLRSAPHIGALAAVQMPKVQAAGTSGRRDLENTTRTTTIIITRRQGGVRKEEIQQ